MKRILKKVLKEIFPRKIIKTEAKIVELSPSELLQNRVALITGGTSGIGFAIAKALLKAGASVCITGRSQERISKAIDELKEYLKENQTIYGEVLDNCKVESLEATIIKIKNKMGCVCFDILINNAGIQKSSFGHTTEEDYDLVMNTNIKGVYFLSQIIAKDMINNSIKGNILNVASASSLRPANTPYILSKWSIKGFTLGLAKMLIPHGIVVNGIAPGATATPMLGRDNTNLTNDRNPMGRMTTADEVANIAVILLSDMGRSIVGDIIYMTGGAGLITLDDVDCNLL